ncbi:amino acid adenylation domain-containing protein [Streptomyces sp. NPDC005571]|uniref:amino acid adenylation domain-containing protein n=1 Tax=Streptomyces sp. NPDC005571 TaxID=3156888 RepID=UPI00339DA91F
MTDLHSRIAALSPEKRALLERRLAERTAATRGDAPEDRIVLRDRSKPTPLAFQQDREWAISRFRPANNIPGAFRVEGALDLELLSRVLTEVTERHEVLRSTVELKDDGSRVQVVHPVTPVPTPVADLTHLSSEQQREEVLLRWKAEVVKPFDTAQPLRLRTSLLRMGPDTHVVLITTDHAAADLVSVAILVREFAALYAAYQNGFGNILTPLAIQYGDFAAWQREFGEQRMSTEVEHWRQTLDGIPGALALPSDRPFPARPNFAGAAHFVDLSAEFADELRQFTDRERVSLGVVLLAATSVLLYRYLGQDDMVIGEIVAGRSRTEVEQLIGCFVTALPLRMRLADGQSLREVVQQARNTVLTAYEHQDLPMERLVEQLGLGYEASQTSLSHMWIDVRTPESTLEVPGLRISQEPIEVNVAAAPLTLDANPGAETLQLQWIYMTEMFDTETVVTFAEQFDKILRQLVAAPDTTVGQVQLAVAPASEVAEPVVVAEAGFVELFQRKVALTPYAPAVITDGVQTSYADLNREANRLAHHLRTLGVVRESRVGILVDRSPALTSAILGVLKAGATYVPLDPGYPPERIAFMLADAGAEVLVTEERLAAVLADAKVTVPELTVLLDGPSPLPDGAACHDLLEVPDPTSAAYVVYTSGSTGLPKGAVIEHHSLATFSRDVVDRLGLGTGDRFLQFASPGFDVLVEELFPTWLAGGTVVIPTGHIISGQVDLLDLVEQERLTVMELPTAYWHEWVRELDRTGRKIPDCLRLVIIGGERILPERLAMWRQFNVPIMHVYGLTETTVSSTFFRLDPADPVREWPNLPIGTALPSAHLRILDRRLRPVPVGATGELYIGGISVARGYLGRPGLTAQRFVADPVRPGQRLYRTGDLIRQRPDGNLEFISRVDTQIKIRGFRVEPTEIESALGRHPQIIESVVTLHEPAPGDRRLVAYLVPGPQGMPSTDELRRFLERELPAYMVPSAFVGLDALPLSPNGKVDHKRLPPLDGLMQETGTEYVAPQTPVQQKLADILTAVVGVGRIGIHDNFFEVGGDSILAIQVVARAQEEGLRLSPYDLFTNPTVASLAEVASAGPSIDADQGDVTGPVPLAVAQRWFCSAGMAEPNHWNRSILLDLPVTADPDLLREAVEQLLAHHDGLRQRFLVAGAKTRVRIAPRGDATPFEVYDLSCLDEAAQGARLAEITAELHTGLDLAIGPLLRAALIGYGGQRSDQLAVVVHRLVADETSMRILAEDLHTLVRQLTAGAPVKLAAKTTSWQSWNRRLAKYTGTQLVQKQRTYWTGLDAAGELPLDHPEQRAADTVERERVLAVSLDAPETTELLKQATEALNCNTTELLLTALARTLGGWSGSGRRLIHLERHDRTPIFEDVDLSRTVGALNRIHPVALTGDPDTSPETTLGATKEALRTVPYEGTGWQLLRQDPDPVPDAPADLLFGYTGEENGLGAGGVGTAMSPSSRRPYPIEVQASVRGGELEVRWTYSESLCEPGTIERLAGVCLDELRTLTALSRNADGLAHTPSDFPLARVGQAQLDDLLGQF